jgi:hypothetical protein
MVGLETANIVFGSVAAGTSLCRDDLDQRFMDGGGVMRGIATDLEMRPILEPAEQVGRLFVHPVLH